MNKLIDMNQLRSKSVISDRSAGQGGCILITGSWVQFFFNQPCMRCFLTLIAILFGTALWSLYASCIPTTLYLPNDMFVRLFACLANNKEHLDTGFHRWACCHKISCIVPKTRGGRRQLQAMNYRIS